MATQTQTVAGRSTWTIDPVHSLVEFSAKHMMITTVKGQFEEVSGTVIVDEDRPNRSSVEVVIPSASINTRSEQRDEHLRSADFLDVENHSEITFRSTRVEGAHAEPGDRFKLFGDLTIRGSTKEVAMDAEFAGSGEDPWGGERASFSASTEIDRREWDLTWNQALEAGGVLVSNKVKISLEVQLVKSE
jgi:polyisoprenoid-binding protein YceI